MRSLNEKLGTSFNLRFFAKTLVLIPLSVKRLIAQTAPALFKDRLYMPFIFRRKSLGLDNSDLTKPVIEMVCRLTMPLSN